MLLPIPPIKETMTMSFFSSLENSPLINRERKKSHLFTCSSSSTKPEKETIS